MSAAVPEYVDWLQVLADLKAQGMLDRDIEKACDLRVGYVAQLRGGHIKEPTYVKGAAIYNLWCQRCAH